MYKKNKLQDVKETIENAKNDVVEKIKDTKETIETGINTISKESIQKNLNDLKDATLDVSKSATKKVKKASATAKKTISKTSEDIVKTVKNNISKDKIWDKEIYIEYFGKQIGTGELVDKFKETWAEEHKLTDINNLKVYYKIEEDTAYYVVNDNVTFSLKLR